MAIGPSQRRDTYDGRVRRPAHLRRVAVRSALLATALLASACGLQQGIDQPPGSDSASPTAAPSISGTTLTGAAFSLAAERGHPVVIDFWAAWCGPCRAEQSDINNLVTSYAGRGVVFLGVDVRDDAAAALAYRHDLGVTYDSVADPSEQISADYNVAAPPTIVLVDQSGRIVNRYLGTVVGLKDSLNRLLS